jgi:alkane 1-monooxygenase
MSGFSVLFQRLAFMAPLLLPGLVVLGYFAGGAGNFLLILVIFGVVPLVDLILPQNTATALSARDYSPGWRMFFDLILYVWVPTGIAIVAWGASVFCSSADLISRIGLTVSVGAMMGSAGIFVAHELGHRRGPTNRGLAYLLLSLIFYAHFLIEHNEGHHVRVATPKDAATASPGETLWHFLPRAIVCGFCNAWRIETRRLRAQHIPVLHLDNRMLWTLIGPVTAVAFVMSISRWHALLYLIGQAAIAVFVIELGNYIEHYGLVRKVSANGKYEPVQIHHSWNSNSPVTSWVSLNLQRHSNHHCRATRRYEALEHIESAPRLPTSYAGMALVALIPPLWRHIMDPRAAKWRTHSGS